MTQRRSIQKKSKYKITHKFKRDGHNKGPIEKTQIEINNGPTENDTKKIKIEKVKIQNNTKGQKK